MKWNDFSEIIIEGFEPFSRIAFSHEEKVMIPNSFCKASAFLLQNLILYQREKVLIECPFTNDLFWDICLTFFIQHLLEEISIQAQNGLTFLPQQNYSIGKAILQYQNEIDLDHDGKLYHCFLLAKNSKRYFRKNDSRLQCFEMADPSKKLSSDAIVNEQIKIKKRHLTDVLSLGEQISLLRTKTKRTTLLICGDTNVLSRMSEEKIDELAIKDCIFIGKINLNGVISSLGNSSLSGPTQILIAQNFYTATLAFEEPFNFSEVIIDFNTLRNFDIFYFDQICEKKIPIYIFSSRTDQEIYSSLSSRGFKFWKWYENLCLPFLTNSNEKDFQFLSNSIHQDISWSQCNDFELSDTFTNFTNEANTKYASENLSNECFKAYFSCLKDCYYLIQSLVYGESKLAQIREDISQFNAFLKKGSAQYEQSFLENMFRACTSLQGFLDMNKAEKQSLFLQKIKENETKRTCLVVSNRDNLSLIENDVQKLLTKNEVYSNVSVKTADDFISSGTLYDLVLIPYWHGIQTMHKLFFSNLSEKYHVLCFPCEIKWFSIATNKWNYYKQINDNEELSKLIFSYTIDDLSDHSSYQINGPKYELSPYSVDSEEIETNVNRQTFSRYISHTEGGKRISVIPVTFSNGSVIFFPLNHDVVCVTDLIQDLSKTYSCLLPEEIKSGDIIVLRKTGSDIIKEIADTILPNKDVRRMSSIWKNVLRAKVAMRIYTKEEEYELLVKNGFKKTYPCFLNWLENDSVILPRDKEDLLIIAIALGDDILLENLDEVIARGKEVQSAHIKAGQQLSEDLKKSFAKTLINKNGGESFAFYDLVSIEIPKIGTVTLYRVKSVGQKLDDFPDYEANKVKEESSCQ